MIRVHRPFPANQPYAESGPTFLHRAKRVAPEPGKEIPEILHQSPHYILRGYDTDDRIVHGSGEVVAQADLTAHARELFDSLETVYIHVRSATNNCHQARIECA